MSDSAFLDKAIRRVQDFPKPGIVFYDITSVLANPKAFSFCIQSMYDMYARNQFDAVAAIEARGFLFAAPFACEYELPLIPIRKKGKLPGRTIQQAFALEYGEDVIEIHADDVVAGWRILLVDDLIATGGTTRASVDLLTRAGASSCEVFSVIGLPFLNFQESLGDIRVRTLIDFHSE
jgi:adenine phosphoribosyltransferase